MIMIRVLGIMLSVLLTINAAWADSLSTSRPSAGASGAVQASNGAGGFADSGVTASGGSVVIPTALTPPSSGSLPGTCTIAQIYFKTGVTAGQNMYGCTASNTWSLLGDGNSTGYGTVKDEGTSLTQRSTINFIGAGITCVDNAGATRTDCTVSGGGSPSAVAPQVTTVNAGNSPYTALTTDWSVRCDTAAAGRTINLPAATNKLMLVIKNLGANACTIARAGTDTIDGATSLVLQAQYVGVVLVSDGVSAWDIQ